MEKPQNYNENRILITKTPEGNYKYELLSDKAVPQVPSGEYYDKDGNPVSYTEGQNYYPVIGDLPTDWRDYYIYQRTKHLSNKPSNIEATNYIIGNAGEGQTQQDREVAWKQKIKDSDKFVSEGWGSRAWGKLGWDLAKGAGLSYAFAVSPIQTLLGVAGGNVGGKVFDNLLTQAIGQNWNTFTKPLADYTKQYLPDYMVDDIQAMTNPGTLMGGMYGANLYTPTSPNFFTNFKQSAKQAWNTNNVYSGFNVEEFLRDRPSYWAVDPDIITQLPKIPRGFNTIQDNIHHYDFKNLNVKEVEYPRVAYNLELQDLFNQQHGYGLDISKYPRHSYMYDGTTSVFEKPQAGPKQLPLLHKYAKDNDVMYSIAHRVWNDMPKYIRADLDKNLYGKMIKWAPPGKYSPGTRAFAISKDIQSQIHNKFMDNNNFQTKDYPEWLEYLDDVISDEQLFNYLKRVHDGYWYGSGYIDTSSKGLETLRETLKYKNGRKIIPKNSK